MPPVARCIGLRQRKVPAEGRRWGRSTTGQITGTRDRPTTGSQEERDGAELPEHMKHRALRSSWLRRFAMAGQILAGVVLLTTDLARAQLDRVGGDAMPPMDGATLEGTVLDEQDVEIDDLGNTRLDLLPTAKQPEPLPPDLEDRLDALSEVREAMAEAVEEDAAPLLVPALNDPDAPPRMDERVRDPDRLRRGAESATADGPIPAYDPERPVDVPSEDSSAADAAAATITK